MPRWMRGAANSLANGDENLAALERDGHDLHGLLEQIVAQARMSASLLEALTAGDTGAAGALEARLRGVIEGVLDRERALGRIDAAIEVEDVATAVSMVAFHAAFVGGDRGADATRAIALVERAFAPRDE